MLEIATICLALNVYFEARGEPLRGQLAVAHVTMNRAKKDVSQVCHEVARERQFSWTIDRVERTKKGWRLKAGYAPSDMKAWELALKVARAVASGKHRDFTQGATHFHAVWVQPAWRHEFKVVERIGGHIFYRAA
jgi:spore germination cell wall hydrolase CwlJ-like protein